MTALRAYTDPVIFRDDRVFRTLLQKQAKYIAAPTAAGSSDDNDAIKPETRREVAAWMLEVCEAHQGSHQFTQYAKSFRHYLTRDVLPSEHNYRNLLSFSRNSQQKRPTMQELRDEENAIKEVRTIFLI